MINLEPDRVMIGNGQSFGCVLMNDFLELLAQKVKKNSASFGNYMRMYVPPSVPPKLSPSSSTYRRYIRDLLRRLFLAHDCTFATQYWELMGCWQHVEAKHDKGMSQDNAVPGETGDSWFNCQKLKLSEHCGFEFQMQYGSIRWAVGATLGYAQAAKDKRVISCIGDGSFQISHTPSFNSWV